MSQANIMEGVWQWSKWNDGPLDLSSCVEGKVAMLCRRYSEKVEEFSGIKGFVKMRK